MRLRSYRMPNRKWWLYGLALVSAAAIHLSASGLYLGVGFVVIALFGARIGSSPEAYRLLFSGFRLGVFVSSLTLMAQTLGVLTFTDIEQQLLGHPGLSYRSTAFAYEAALSLILWHRSGHGKVRTPVWLLEGAVVAAALLASGGRGGLLALAVAMVVLPLSAGRVKTTVRFVATAAAALAVISTLGLSTLSVERLLPQVRDRRIDVVDQYGSGRRDILQVSIERARQHWIIGAGFEESSVAAFGASASYATTSSGTKSRNPNAHILVLALLIIGGIVLATSATVVLVAAGVKAYVLAARGSPQISWIAAGIVIYLVNSLLEVGGGLVGLQSVLLFSALVRLAELNAGPRRVRSTDRPMLRSAVLELRASGP